MDIRNDARAGHRKLIEVIRAQPNAIGVHAGMMLVYHGMPEAFAPVLPRLFQHLLDERNLPMVIHCHAGKDRTGFICALILAALGVSHEDVVADYMLTAQRIDRERLSVDLVESFSEFVGVPLTIEALQVALDVRSEYLEASLQSLDRDYGGMDAYLEKIGKLTIADRERLRQVLLR